MQKYFVSLVALLTFSGCAGPQNSFKQTTLNDMYPILTEAQYDTLKSLNGENEIAGFLDRFWQAKDSTSGSEPIDLKTEYLQRLEYANIHFPDRRGWGRSDRKRIYLLYGPPSYIERYDYADDALGPLSTIKAFEVWLYIAPGKDNNFPSFVDDFYLGQEKFIFADMTGSGFYTLLYSSENGADIDVRMFKHQ